MPFSAPDGVSPLPDTPSAAAIAAAGCIGLAVAMGVGRFAFTPILPMMLHDGVVDLHAASWLASANYLGYLVGALLCMIQPLLWARRPGWRRIAATAFVRTGLVATVLLTLAMAVPIASLWPLWRFAAGVASAVVFVYSLGWCLAELAARGRPALGGAIFAGPGAGIVGSGLLASGLVAWHAQAAAAWLLFGVLGALLSAAVWRIFSPAATVQRFATGPAATEAALGVRPAIAPAGAFEIGSLALAYGIAGFGYIVTATFLPVIARAAMPGSAWLDLFWPIFGVGVVIGALVSTRLHIDADLRLLLAAAYGLQAIAIGIGIGSPTLIGFAAGSFLLGLPFTAITFFALQEARRLRPLHVPSTIGLITALYGLGQIAGPPMVAMLLRSRGDAAHAFSLSLGIAALALLAGALIYVSMWRVWPKRG